MFYRNVYGRVSESSILKIPAIKLRKADSLKIEFYYYIKSSGYQSLELYRKADDGHLQQLWRTEAVPPELEEVWTYACVNVTETSSGKIYSSLDTRQFIFR